MALVLLAGAQVAARSRACAHARSVAYGRWMGMRMARPFRPVAAVPPVWMSVAAVMLALGVDFATETALTELVWFLLVFAALTAATPLVARLHPVWPLVAVALGDLVRSGPV